MTHPRRLRDSDTQSRSSPERKPGPRQEAFQVFYCSKAVVAVESDVAERRAGLWDDLYPRLHRLARRKMANEFRRPTFESHELVQEAWARLALQAGRPLGDREILGVASIMMQRILVDRARFRSRVKRDVTNLPPEEFWRRGWNRKAKDDDFPRLVVAEALERLKNTDPRQAQIVTLRCVAGLTLEETAEVLGVSRRTVDRDWVHAKAWLRRELAEVDGVEARRAG